MSAAKAKFDTAQRAGRGMLIRVNAEGLKALRLLAIEKDTTLQDLAVEALNDVLEKNGKRRTVKNPSLNPEPR